MAKIGLFDVDSHNFPNLAIMKISSYHKNNGDEVEFVRDFEYYDKVYKSKVFTFSSEREVSFNCDCVVYGGTGYELNSKLPEEIEKQRPDYSIYPQYDYAVGYLTRGCPRNCPFCIVGKKEGFESYKISDISSFYNGQKEIKLLDPNITACNDRVELLRQLKDTKAKIDFTQGLDIRFMTDDVIDLILQMNVKMLHFAYDRMNQKDLIEKNLIKFRNKSGYKRNKVSVFILTNYETSFDEDLYRIKFIKDLGFQPYMMIYNKQNELYGKSKYLRLQQYVNAPRFFWGCSFKEFQELQFKNSKWKLEISEI